MVSNLRKLSAGLDQAAPKPVSGTELITAIRSNMNRIEAEINQNGRASVTVHGKRFEIRRNV